MKPDFVTDEHLTFLDALRNTGVTNMFSATPYIQQFFPELSERQAMQVLKHWMFERGREPHKTVDVGEVIDAYLEKKGGEDK